MLVDDDHEFTERNVVEMICLLEERYDQDLPSVPLLGWYALRCKSGSFEPHVSVKPHEPTPPIPGLEYFGCDNLPYWVGGLGFCGMNADAFWRIHHPVDDDWVCVDDSLPLIRGVYSSGPSGHFWRSEDVSFCVHSHPQLAEKCVIEHAGRYPTVNSLLLDDKPITEAMRKAVSEWPAPKHVCKQPKRTKRRGRK